MKSLSLRRVAAHGVVGLVALAGGLRAPGQEAVKAEKPAGPPKPVELKVGPAAAPVPALRYRVLPIESERTPGDAAPIYLRIRHELTDGYKDVQQKPPKWLELPFDQFPAEEARKFVDAWQSRLELIGYAARREYCDWSFTLPEQRLDSIEILLPDTQEMRTWARLLSVKARVEIAEKKYDEAIRTIQTGIAMGRHVAEGPFLINDLVGMAICNEMLARVEELVQQPGAPNLYWAITALPRPLVSLRNALEFEQRLGENMIPELDQAERPRNDAEWEVFLGQLYGRIQSLAAKMAGFGEDSEELKKFRELDVAKFRAVFLPAAREWFAKAEGIDAEAAGKRPEAEVLARYVVGQYRELRDEVYKLAYLPYDQAAARYEGITARLKAAQSGPAGPLARLAGPLALFAAIQPALLAAQGAEVKTDRRVAALRVVEAIRLYAAAHEGRLPESLDAIEEVPVPLDPATGQPFDYAVEDETAKLSGPVAQLNPPRLDYRITIRK